MAEEKENNGDFAGRELSISRVLNAPVELVWEVFIKPEHIKNWWGPNGFTNTIHKMEVKPGGVWDFIMHGPDGTNYPNKSVFKEVVPYSLIVFEHYAPNFTTTINFIAEGKKTLIKWHMLFESKELFETVVKNHKADKGLEQNIEKLEKYLSSSTTSVADPKPFLVTRILNAPIDLVFKAFSEAKHLAQWWGPKGFDIEVNKLEFKPGGVFHYSMKMPDGNKMWGKFVYHEIAAPGKIVFVNSFSDENGNITRAPFSPSWPLEVMNTLTLVNDNGKTILTLAGGPINASDEERETFAKAFDSMQQGFGGTFDQLEAYLPGIINELFVIERTFNAPIAKVWSAITNRDEMKQWYFGITEFKPEVGFEFTFTGSNEGRTFIHLCKVTEVVPGTKLAYSWRYRGYEGISHVTWELFAEGNKTRLKLTHSGLESFPVTAHRDFARENFAMGWTHIIGTSLQQYIEK